MIIMIITVGRANIDKSLHDIPLFAKMEAAGPLPALATTTPPPTRVRWLLAFPALVVGFRRGALALSCPSRGFVWLPPPLC